jgi:hypothetical protein
VVNDFIRGLKDEIRTGLLRLKLVSPEKFTTLSGVTELAIAVSVNEASAREMIGQGKPNHFGRDDKQKPGNHHGKTKPDGQHNGSNGQGQRDQPRGKTDTGKIIGNDRDRSFDKTGQKKTLSPEEKDKLLKDNLCFNCKKPGHRSRNCPEKDKSAAGSVPAAQSNGSGQVSGKALSVQAVEDSQPGSDSE